MAQCQECVKDHGFCIYCQQRYASPQNLHTHIKRVHPETIRAQHCEETR